MDTLLCFRVTVPDLLDRIYLSRQQLSFISSDQAWGKGSLWTSTGHIKVHFSFVWFFLLTWRYDRELPHLSRAYPAPWTFDIPTKKTVRSGKSLQLILLSSLFSLIDSPHSTRSILFPTSSFPSSRSSPVARLLLCVPSPSLFLILFFCDVFIRRDVFFQNHMAALSKKSLFFP